MRKISVAIPTYNRYDKLINLLETLEKQKCDEIEEVIIVDASEKMKYISSSLLKINQVKALEPNLPLQRRQAIEFCKTKYIAFFDDDTLPESNYLNLLFNYIETHPNYAGISGWINHIPSSSFSRKRRFRLVISGINLKNQGKRNKAGIPIPFYTKPKEGIEVEYLQGPSMMFSTDLIKENGDLPWLYKLYRNKIGRAEDIALSTSLIKNQYKLFLLPTAVCNHLRDDGGTPFSKNGYNKGLSDTYGRYLLYKNTLNSWNFNNKIFFFLYVFITMFVSNKMMLSDKKYIKGFFKGIFMIFIKKQ